MHSSRGAKDRTVFAARVRAKRCDEPIISTYDERAPCPSEIGSTERACAKKAPYRTTRASCFEKSGKPAPKCTSRYTHHWAANHREPLLSPRDGGDEAKEEKTRGRWGPRTTWPVLYACARVRFPRRSVAGDAATSARDEERRATKPRALH